MKRDLVQLPLGGLLQGHLQSMQNLMQYKVKLGCLVFLHATELCGWSQGFGLIEVLMSLSDFKLPMGPCSQLIVPSLSCGA
jgi:hypothetical protein